MGEKQLTGLLCTKKICLFIISIAGNKRSVSINQVSINQIFCKIRPRSSEKVKQPCLKYKIYALINYFSKGTWLIQCQRIELLYTNILICVCYQECQNRCVCVCVLQFPFFWTIHLMSLSNPQLVVKFQRAFCNLRILNFTLNIVDLIPLLLYLLTYLIKYVFLFIIIYR